MTSRPATDVTIEGENLSPLTVSMSIAAPKTAPLEVTNSPLTMTAGQGGGKIRVTNRSSTLTATDIVADFTGTPLVNAVKQDASDCASVAPGESCSLRFHVGMTAVAPTSFPIKGINTNPVGATIEVSGPTKASLSVAGSPLVLQAAASSPSAGHLIVTNTSTIVANQISAQLTGTALDGLVVQDDSQCTSLAPGASCQLNFTPASTAVATTPIIIQGSNTSQLPATITVDAIRPTLSVSNSPLTLIKSGAARALTITNDSSTITIDGIDAQLAGTALAGHVTVSGNTCSGHLAPGAHCTISFLPGAAPVASTSFPITSLNAQTLIAAVAVHDLAIGDGFGGGTVIRLPSPSANGLIATKNSVLAMPWAADATATPTAQSMTDGVANTVAIVAKYGAANDYSAGYCDGLTTNDGGLAYSNWYLPAFDEAMEFGVAYRSSPASFPGMSSSFILTSTEHNAFYVKTVSLGSISGGSYDGKNYMRPYAGTHCLHSF